MGDILVDLKEWRDELDKNAEHRDRVGGLTELDIAKITRAIDAIEHLRAEIKRLTADDQSNTRSIEDDDIPGLN